MTEDPISPSAGAMAELEAALREATGLLRSLKADNERLERQLAGLKARPDRLVARIGNGEADRPAPHAAAGPTAQTPAEELAGRVIELEEQRRGWLRERRRLAERVEGILDKLEYLQSESNSN